MELAVSGLLIFSSVIDLVTPFVFLLLFYKFKDLGKSYGLTAFKELSIGFGCLFVGYLVPLFIQVGVEIIQDDYDLALVDAALSSIVSVGFILAFYFFLSSVQSFVKYARENA